MSEAGPLRLRPDRPPPRVLCVDDEEVTLGLVVRLLERMGLSALPVRSAAAALGLFEAGRFDLVVTDVRMPDLDGHAFLAEIRRRDPRVPVVVATGTATDETAILALGEGATSVLRKPFTGSEFETEIARALSSRARMPLSAGRDRASG